MLFAFVFYAVLRKNHCSTNYIGAVIYIVGVSVYSNASDRKSVGRLALIPFL